MAKKVLLKTSNPTSGSPNADSGSETVSGRTRTQFDDTADLRDAINNLVGYGYTSLDLQDAKGNYATLKRVLGEPNAQKMLNKIIIQNTRPDLLKSSAIDRLNFFYESGANDKDLGDVLKKVRAFGHGVSGDIYNSSNAANRTLVGNTTLGNNLGINTMRITNQKPTSSTSSLGNDIAVIQGKGGVDKTQADFIGDAIGIPQKKVMLKVRK